MCGNVKKATVFFRNNTTREAIANGRNGPPKLSTETIIADIHDHFFASFIFKAVMIINAASAKNVIPSAIFSVV